MFLAKEALPGQGHDQDTRETPRCPRRLQRLPQTDNAVTLIVRGVSWGENCDCKSQSQMSATSETSVTAQSVISNITKCAHQISCRQMIGLRQRYARIRVTVSERNSWSWRSYYSTSCAIRFPES